VTTGVAAVSERARSIGERVGVVVVNFNAGEALVQCIESLRGGGVRQLVIVDNGSTDNSIELLRLADPEARVIRTRRNLGFGGGINVGAAVIETELLLFSNPDILLEPGALNALVGRLDEDPALGVVGPGLVDSKGELQRSGGRFPSIRRSAGQAISGAFRPNGPRSTRRRREYEQQAIAGDVDWLTGACLLARREAFDAVDGFDPGYFMYVEEVDFCWRLARAGWRAAYLPEARVVHIGGVSTRARPYSMIVAHHLSLWRYARRTTEGIWRAALPLVAVGLALRCGVVLARRAAEAAVRAPSDA
jgi:N-acetylglucosaminyl-diphospho-decaprenol L-rhamnosyltransferase